LRLIALHPETASAAAAAASGLWVAFFGALRIAGVIVAGIGIALAVAALPREVVDPGALRTSLWELVSRQRERALEEAGRVTALGVAGLVALFSPSLALSIAMVVSGAVLRPGKILAERPISALEAVMEAGGFDPAKANPKAVTVIRNEDGQLRHFILNLKDVLEGRSTKSFYLRPSDVVHVPERPDVRPERPRVPRHLHRSAELRHPRPSVRRQRAL